MTTTFSLFYDTLQKEKSENNKYVPQQYYAKDHAQFNLQFLEYAKENNLSSCLVLTDGEFKKSDLESSEDIQNVFLKNTSLKLEWINLSKECGVNPKDIHASEFFLKKLMSLLSEKTHTHYIALGSGTITDLLKHALFLLKKENIYFISIPTATTVTAFTSAFSVVDIDGAKRTRPSQNIHATFWIEPLLKAAPLSMLKAGFGDLLAFFVAYGDWYLGHELNLSDNYDEIAFRLMMPFKFFLTGPELMKISPQNYLFEHMNLFSQTLAMAGVSMSICGQTAPLSGYEHVISHGLDFLKLNSNRELVLHGEQVALSTMASSTSFQWLINEAEFSEKNFRNLNEKEISLLLNKLFLKAPFMDNEEKNITHFVELFLPDYNQKNERWKNAQSLFPNFLKRWPEIKKHLSQLVLPPTNLEQILIKMELPYFPESTYPKTAALEFRWAVRFAPFVRSRFCLADFIFWIGEDPCAIATV